MVSKLIIYLYRGYPDKIRALAQEQQDGIYFRQNGNLVGIDLATMNTVQRAKIVKDYFLREFEVEQDKFEDIIQILPSLGARITSLEVRRSEERPDLEECLVDALISQNISEICRIIQEYQEMGNDVEALEFVWNANRIRFSRLAELDLSSNALDVNGILEDIPVGILAGVVRGRR